MTQPIHHLSDSLLLAYATGSLPHALSLVVASHISMCKECRAGLEAHQMAGGVLLEELQAIEIEPNLKASVLSKLQETPIEREQPARFSKGMSIFPAPILEATNDQPVKWSSVGGGVRQSILFEDEEGSARLLYVPPGKAVPDHGHSGIELTLVLQGSFSDKTGRYGRGDVEVADDNLEHTPIADAGEACICIAATEAPLKFNNLIPRLLQPIFRI